PAPAAACAAGALLGSMNGALVAYAGIPSIVVTLATMTALRDGLRWATEGAWVSMLPASFQWVRVPPAPLPAGGHGHARRPLHLVRVGARLHGGRARDLRHRLQCRRRPPRRL